MGYGKRICLECGKEFEAGYVAQLCCSMMCQKARNKKLKQKHAITVGQLRKDYAALENRVTMLEEMVWATVKDEAGLKDESKEPEPVPELELVNPGKDPDYIPGDEFLPKDDGRPVKKGKGLPPLTEYCERMKVKATALPCGKNARCYEPTPCRRIPPGTKRPVSSNFGNRL